MNIPWGQIKLRWIQGESASGISKSLGDSPTRQGISKRARKENWKQLPTVSAKHLELSYLQLGQDTPDNREAVLKALAEGVSYTLASGIIGVARNTLLNWRKADPVFEAQCRAARHSALADCARTIYQQRGKDWKAGKFLLQSAKETDGEYQEQDRPDNKLEIIININREAPGVTINGKTSESVGQGDPAIIDVTPEKVNGD